MRQQQQTNKPKLRLLLVSHYYPPECNAPARRISEFAHCWSRSGMQVEVLTGMPNHPTGVIPPEYRNCWYRREETDGVTVHRSWIYPAANRGIIRRSLNYLSFAMSAVLNGLWNVRRPDCVIATSPQLFCAAAGWLLSVAKRVPFIFEVRDVWPEEIVAVGAIRNRLVIHLLECIEMFLYRRARHIIAVAEGTVTILVARGIPASKITVIPNGVDTNTFVPEEHDNGVRQSHNLNGEFLVSYIGTVGMAHRLEVLLDAADILRDEEGIKFLIVGDGAARRDLEAKTKTRALDNIVWAEPQPANRIAAYYNASDACLVHLRAADLFTKNIPSKRYEIMATGRPILLGTNGESRRLGIAAGCALPFAPESADELACAIHFLARSPEITKTLGASGRQYVVAHNDRADLAERYLELLTTIIGIRSVDDQNSAQHTTSQGVA
jgi:glycosyltransferase involved in cell wall biosynthesis